MDEAEATVGARSSPPESGQWAHVYVVHHAGHAAVKVGICADGSSRIEAHRRHGWTLVGSLACSTRAEAWRIEQAVIRLLRGPLRLDTFLTAAQMPQCGWGETFSAELMPPQLLWHLVRDMPGRLAAETEAKAKQARDRAACREEHVTAAAVEAASAPCPVDRDVLTRGQLYALFGRTGAVWHHNGLTARLNGQEVHLRNGPVMLAAISIDPASLTVTGLYRVLLYRETRCGGSYAQVTLPAGVVPANPVEARRRRLPGRRRPIA